MSIAGVIACAQNAGHTIDFPKDIHPMIRAGLLRRDGNYLTIVEAEGGREEAA